MFSLCLALVKAAIYVAHGSHQAYANALPLIDSLSRRFDQVFHAQLQYAGR